MFRRGCNVAVVGRTAAPAAPLSSKRHALVAKPMHSDYPAHYNPQQKLVAGADISLKMTEFYDGFTDDFGVFKEGPPTTLRYEYLRAPEHVSALNLHARHLWCPFQSGTQLRSYSPHFRDYGGLSSRDQFGHRSGYMPGDKFKMGHYERKERFWSEESYSMNNKPEMRVPKWLAVVINDEFGKGLIGFFLYAHGGYCCEYLSHKQLPRLVYNKPHLGYLPTVGQTVELSEVTFGKELHSLQMYHSTGHTMCIAGGSAAVVLRGSEPNLVPILLPSKEVRLFDTVNRAVFGRRAGLLSNQTRCQGMAMHRRFIRDRPRVRMLSRRVGSGPNTGGIDKRRNAPWRLDWRWLQAINFRTKYFLSGYILRGRQYTKHKSVADLKAKTYGWDSRDPLYR